MKKYILVRKMDPVTEQPFVATEVLAVIAEIEACDDNEAQTKANECLSHRPRNQYRPEPPPEFHYYLGGTNP